MYYEVQPDVDIKHNKSLTVDYVVKVFNSLEIQMYIKNSRLPNNLFDHVLKKTGTLSSLSELCNVLSVAKSFCDDQKCSSASGFIEFAKHLIKRYLIENEENEPNLHGGITFHV